MAKKQNPYQLWLGLHPNLTNPNLFQLLGVDPRSQDEAAIKQKAVASAKALIQKLKAVEPKNDAEKVFKQKLHAKIVLAHETVISPEKRKKYLNALVATAAAQKKATAPPPNPTAPKNTASDQPVANASGTPLAPPPPSPPLTASAGTQPVKPPANPTANPPSEIPSAIPMAMPVSATHGVSDGDNVAAGFSVIDASEGQSGPNFDNLDAEPQIKVYAKKRKTSRSWVVPIVVLTLLVGGVGGLVSIMTKYSNIFELVPGLQEQMKVSQDGSNAAGNSSSANAPKASSPAGVEGSTGESLKVPKTPVHAIEYKGDEDPDMEIPEGGMPPLKVPENNGSMTTGGETGSMSKGEFMKEMRKESGNDRSESDDADQDNAKKAGAEDSLTEKTKVEDGQAATERTLDNATLNSIRLALHRSRDALFRQDRNLANHFNSDVKELLKRYEIANAKSVAPPQQGLIRAAETNDQVIGWVDDFWEQVKSSSIETAGGDSIILGDKTMALVEGSEEDIVLRVAGQNERIRYSNLTPMLAITLGDRGSKESVPRWNLAQAAYLGVMAEQYDHLKQKQNQILDLVKMDGFDLESQAIADFTEPDWLKLGLPEKKLPPFSDEQFDELIADSRERLGYDDPPSVPMDQVDALIYKLTINPTKDDATRICRLWDAVAMIKKGLRSADLMFVNRELNNCCTEVDFNKSFVDPILHIAKNAKDPRFQDQIARQMINFVKQFGGNPNFTRPMREKLVQSVGKIAIGLKSGQLAAMAEQLSQASK